MELKCQKEQPCQNPKYCSNRTFMELKLRKNFSTILGLHSSNRTFMELKLNDSVQKLNYKKF